MKMRHTLVFAACCSALVSCRSSKHDDSEKYFLVVANTKVPYWQTASAGIARAAKDMGVHFEIVGPETYEPKAQQQAFQKAISDKATGILVNTSDAQLLQPEIDSAIQHSIP